jgi:hypothetical protein
MAKSDFNLPKKVARYYQLTIYARWIVVVLLWLTLGVYSIWSLRHEIELWLDYFTWSAVHYGLAFNLIPTICLGICVGMTLSVLLWQSSHILWGFSDKEKYYLENKVNKILAKGSSHPLWKWINQE